MAIPPDKIYSINVLKGESAAPFWEKVKNGIILITTRRSHARADTTGSSKCRSDQYRQRIRPDG